MGGPHVNPPTLFMALLSLFICKEIEIIDTLLQYHSLSLFFQFTVSHGLKKPVTVSTRNAKISCRLQIRWMKKRGAITTTRPFAASMSTLRKTASGKHSSPHLPGTGQSKQSTAPIARLSLWETASSHSSLRFLLPRHP